MALLAHALQEVEVRLKPDSNEEHFTLQTEQFFVHISLALQLDE
jgi:hypothetical protein